MRSLVALAASAICLIASSSAFAAPSASFTVVTPNPTAGQPVTFDPTTDSVDPLATADWDFQNNGVNELSGVDPNANQQFTFSTPGTYFVKLVVQDGTGVGQSIAPVTVAPPNSPPVAQFDFDPASPVVGQQVFVESFSFDPDGSIVTAEWDFDGDLDYSDGDVNTADPFGDFTYTTTGTKTIRLRVTDNRGATDVRARNVTIGPLPANQLPVVQFAISPSQPVVGQQTSFQSFSYDPDGSVAAQRWDLDGDGDFDENITGATAFTTFVAPGPRIVRLQVEDDDGDTQTATVDVNVQPAPVPPTTPPVTPPTTPPIVNPSGPSLLAPFPIVRMTGSVLQRGTRVRLLEVRAPRGSLVTVRCAGRRCPSERLRKTAAARRLRFIAMQRVLPPGTVVSVSVTKRGAIGKFTRWKIRELKVPKRTDLCLWPSGRKARCPVG